MTYSLKQHHHRDDRAAILFDIDSSGKESAFSPLVYHIYWPCWWHGKLQIDLPFLVSSECCISSTIFRHLSYFLLFPSICIDWSSLSCYNVFFYWVICRMKIHGLFFIFFCFYVNQPGNWLYYWIIGLIAIVSRDCCIVSLCFVAYCIRQASIQFSLDNCFRHSEAYEAMMKGAQIRPSYSRLRGIAAAHRGFDIHCMSVTMPVQHFPSHTHSLKR